MPGAKQAERGIKSPYSARYRVDIGPCSGLDLSHDSATLTETALRQAINVRVHDGIVVSRGGQSAPTTTAGDGCIQGLIDIDVAGTRAVLATNESLVGGNTRSQVEFFDENLASGSRIIKINQATEVQAHPNEGSRQGQDYEITFPRHAYLWWNGDIVFQNEVDDTLHRIILPEPGEDIDAEELQTEELLTLQVEGELAAFEVSSMITMPQAGNVNAAEPIYFGTMAGGVVGYANGQMARLQADGTFSSRVILFQYNNQLFACGTHELRYQSGGWTQGGSVLSTAWTDIPFPVAGSRPTAFNPQAGIEWRGFGYIGGFDGDGSGVDSGWIMRLSGNGSGTPVLTAHLNAFGGALDHLKSVDTFGIGRSDTLYVGFRYDSVASDFGVFGTFNGTSLTQLVSLGETEGTVPAIQGTQDKVYFSGWSSDDESGIYAWDGSTETVVASLGFGGTPSWWDMVLF